MSPSGFNIDIRTLKIKSMNKEWITLLDKPPSAGREITGISSVAPRSLVPSGEYTAILVGYGSGWFLSGSYTNTEGLITNFILTNKVNLRSEYILFGTPEAVSEIKGPEYPYSNAAASILGIKGFMLAGGDYKEIYLYFDTLGIISLYTNSSGDPTNIAVAPPTIAIDIK